MEYGGVRSERRGDVQCSLYLWWEEINESEQGSDITPSIFCSLLWDVTALRASHDNRHGMRGWLEGPEIRGDRGLNDGVMETWSVFGRSNPTVETGRFLFTSTRMGSCVSVWVHVAQVHVCASQRTTSSVVLQALSTSFEMESLHWPLTHQGGWLTTELQESTYLLLLLSAGVSSMHHSA